MSTKQPDERPIRDGIQARIRELIATRLGEMREGRTAHGQRLGMPVTMLDGEFGNVKPAEEIRACAAAVLDGFSDARIHSHILALPAARPASVCAVRRAT